MFVGASTETYAGDMVPCIRRTPMFFRRRQDPDTLLRIPCSLNYISVPREMSPHFRKVLVWENQLFFKKCGKKCGMSRLLEAERLEERFMQKKIASITVLLLTLFSLSGCSEIGSKTTSMSVIYGATAVLSLLLLLGYCAIMRKREFWFLLLFSSVVIVNAGYFSLSISRTIEEALLANRIAYLGSVFLPMAMLMIILNTTRLRYKKWLPVVLLVLSVAVFLVAASPGYLDIYYKAVSIVTVNGGTVLQGIWSLALSVPVLSHALLCRHDCRYRLCCCKEEAGVPGTRGYPRHCGRWKHRCVAVGAVGEHRL